MMKRWLEKAEAEMGTQQILLDCLNDIAIRVETLENALVDQVLENIQSLTHSLKGGTGTLRMSEIYLKISDMEGELIKESFDMDKVQKEFSSAKEMLALIPKKYFDMERLELEKRKYEAGKLLILVVDDNVENRKLIGHILNRLNFKYKDAENGEVALEMLQTESFSLVSC